MSIEQSSGAGVRTASTEHDEALRGAIARARRSPFYAQHLAGHELRTRADLTALPLTFKSHLRDASPFGMLAVPAAKAWHYHESSGTTGEPISTWCGLGELRLMAAVVHRMVPELAQDTVLLNRFPLFAPVSFVFEEALRMAGACHIAAGNVSWDVPFTRALDFMRRLKVTALSCLPLEPILLRELAREQGVDLKEFASLKVIFAGGAVLTPALRRVIETDWSARVVEIYGSNETMLMGVGCTAGRLHLCTNLLEFEVLDPATHIPVAAGQPGLLTVTSLVHEAMPLVRYVTGDLVRVRTEFCRCGQAGQVAEVFGRADEVVEIGGARATSYDIMDAAYDFADGLGTRVFFMLIRKRGLHLLIEVAEPQRARDASAERTLAERIGLPVTVEYLAHNEVMDRTALFRTPKIYKPTQISDWRGDGRKTITIMEALLEWPQFDWRTLMHIGLRQLRNARRRRRLLREDR
ncbi:MAG: phenylacetate--CoA ligase family protein [Deltaproteobacteria bacterium]|nr:phenylacetate--CoA ligase family protein [Deltaproteobacteria bacterium]MBI3386627.1 phenylacetate--CoA ligase family protein [Deltaproteobacteria bacterium]